MSNILIIGGDSFIAQTFVNKYKERYSFSLVSRIKTGFKTETILDDLFTINDSLFKNIDVVINFAAIVHQPKVSDAGLYDRINHRLPVFIAEKAKKKGVKHFIQMSTIAVYEESESLKFNSKTNPSTLYGVSKLKADEKLLNMLDENFLVSCIRAPLVYGGGASPGNMIKLIKFASKGVYLPFGKVYNSRDFINVNNLLLAFNAIIVNSLSGVVIPTDRNAVSTEDIIKLACKISGTKERLLAVPDFLLDILMKIKPSIFKKLYGSLLVECNIDEDYYDPIYSLYDGLQDIYNAIQKK